MLSVGAILLVSRLGDMGSIITCGGTWVLMIVMAHVLRLTSPQAGRWFDALYGHMRAQKWRRFVQTLCGMTLGLSEAVRSTLAENGVERKGRLSLLLIIVMSIVTAARFKEPAWQIKVLLQVSAVTSLITFTYVEKQNIEWSLFAKAQSWSDYVWLMLSLDYLMQDQWYHVGVVVASVVDSNTMGAWSFVWGVLPCMGLWQREQWMCFRSIWSNAKPERVMYCLACVATMALCGAVYAPCWQTVLAMYCALHWFGVLSSCWRILFS